MTNSQLPGQPANPEESGYQYRPKKAVPNEIHESLVTRPYVYRGKAEEKAEPKAKTEPKAKAKRYRSKAQAPGQKTMRDVAAQSAARVAEVKERVTKLTKRFQSGGQAEPSLTGPPPPVPGSSTEFGGQEEGEEQEYDNQPPPGPELPQNYDSVKLQHPVPFLGPFPGQVRSERRRFNSVQERRAFYAQELAAMRDAQNGQNSVQRDQALDGQGLAPVRKAQNNRHNSVRRDQALGSHGPDDGWGL